MPRAPKAIKKPNGCPQKAIDWVIVDEYLIAGCPGTKIAQALGIHPETLYARCELEKGIGFSAYSQQKRIVGDALLHKAQFDKALGRNEKGDNTLLIWLGKTRLDQKENTEVVISPEIERSYVKIMNQLEEMQKNRHNIPLRQSLEYDEE